MTDSQEMKRWIQYWRNSLADADSFSGALNKSEMEKKTSVNHLAWQKGKLEHGPTKGLFKDKSPETLLVLVNYFPFIFRHIPQHGVISTDKLPEHVSPIICKLWVHRDGWLLPATDPMMPRDLLAPQSDDDFVLNTMEALDQFSAEDRFKSYSEEEAMGFLANMSEDAEHQAKWQLCRDRVALLFKRFAQEILTAECAYQRVEQSYLQPSDDIGNATRNIITLYDSISGNLEDLPLLNTYALVNQVNHQLCLDPLGDIAQRLGHSNSQFPLAEAQRDALAQTLAMKEGEMLAINGPPGTGKTTFVLSVVASLWVDAALAEKEPPLIVAASTNNQAVTNVIEAFGKDFEETDDPISGRWLPDISSYGGYLPSKSKERDAAKNFQTSSFYFEKETPEYREQATQIFTEKASAFFDEEFDCVEAIKGRLHEELEKRVSQIKQLDASWKRLCHLNEQYEQLLSGSPEATLLAKQTKVVKAKKRHEQAVEDSRKWQEYSAEESLLLGLFSFLPPIARKRRLLRQLFIERHFAHEFSEHIVQSTNLNIDEEVAAYVSRLKQSLETSEAEQADWENLLSNLKTEQESWSTQVQKISPDLNEESLDSIDPLLDTTLRFNLFQLAVHYWEARWLIECEERADELMKQSVKKPKTGLKSVRPRWLRWMKLTPCVVSTLHSLPAHMTYVAFEQDEFDKRYLWNEIDLLIIDEAGQVAPDVAGASFALAKRALVIGDIYQIKPINQQLPSIDYGNMMEAGLTASTEVYNDLIDRNEGRDVTTGSVMRIAQQASLYHYLDDAEPGMFLREHRRCYDEIIDYSNKLCYNGLLLPRRGSSDDSKEALPQPALGYLHIDGCAVSPPAGSLCNHLEAKTIADWLVENRESLESHYGDTLKNIVGVVTPFRAQVELISSECEKLGINAGRDKEALTVGTVHALQGAERKVVIFSQVYSRHVNGQFIDSDPSLLNVAVSRAKDSFLVFGDMDVIGSAPVGSPRHLLGRLLKEREDAELTFAAVVRPDLEPLSTQPKILNNAEEHDRYLIDLLSKAQKEFDMVSPWVLLHCLKTNGLLSAIESAVKRGVVFRLHTDLSFNTQDGNKPSQKKKEAFEACCQALMESGIKVIKLQNVHSKLLIMDDTTLCIGSFNWASAARDGKYKNMETSVAYQGQLQKEIDVQRVCLASKSCNSNTS